MIAFTENAKELGEMLIKSFQDLPAKDRHVLTNNTFMVASQIRQTFGNEIEQEMKKFSNEDWRDAWVLFDDHFYEEE